MITTPKLLFALVELSLCIRRRTQPQLVTVALNGISEVIRILGNAVLKDVKINAELQASRFFFFLFLFFLELLFSSYLFLLVLYVSVELMRSSTKELVINDVITFVIDEIGVFFTEV